MAHPSSAHDLSQKARDLVSAALRHLRDAELLLNAEERSSPDGAFYLAGYAPELVRKATLAEDWLDRAIGHITEAPQRQANDLEEATVPGAAALLLATELDPIAHRYAHRNMDAIHVLNWSTAARYKCTGSYRPESARRLIEEACRFTDDLLLDMWADGRFPRGTVPW